MAVKSIKGSLTVLDAAKIRIRNLFHSGCKVYLSFSAGKDSLCVSSLIYDLILAGEIDRKQLTVIFFDEEGIYRSMVQMATEWRDKFIGIGVPFLWYCLPFKQLSCLDKLSSTETWITWDQTKRDAWIREPPPYAIMEHPEAKVPGKYNYVQFSDIVFRDGVQVLGLRVAESMTRRRSLSAMKYGRLNERFYPIYDWGNHDVWLYIKEKNLYFPEIYIRLYEAGVKKHLLRLSCFFGADSIIGLQWVAQTDPELWERIEKREPNAYLALLYWDSEMFARKTRKRTQLESGSGQKNYYELCKELFLNPDAFNIPPDTKKLLPRWRWLFIRADGMMLEEHYQKMFESIIKGDPKMRNFRTLYSAIFSTYTKSAVQEAGRCTK